MHAISPLKQYFCTLSPFIGFFSSWTSTLGNTLWERSVATRQPPRRALASDGGLTEAETTFLMYTDMPSAVCPMQTSNTNNAVSVLQSDVTWQMWVTPARRADFDFCYLGQSSLLCRGGSSPLMGGEKGFNQRLHLFCKFARKAHLGLCGPSTSFHQSHAWPHLWLSHLLTADLGRELERWQPKPLKFNIFPSETRFVRGCQLWPCLPFSFKVGILHQFLVKRF